MNVHTIYSDFLIHNRDNWVLVTMEAWNTRESEFGYQKAKSLNKSMYNPTDDLNKKLVMTMNEKKEGIATSMGCLYEKYLICY
jgi:hypothetical protein